jgi:hypothetical protein
MTRTIATLAALIAAATAGVGSAQTGHPAKGSWIGYWGPASQMRNRILLVLDWEDRGLVGTINPGRNAVSVRNASIDYATWTMTVEADMPLDGGGTAPYVATGKLENLGSWVNRRYTGTYTHGDESGVFRMTLN